jgi:DNA polymerase IV
MGNLTSLPFDRILPFNPKHSTRMYIDLNSCFATIEQQCNVFLRGKAVAVGAYETPGGCIIAPSIEAKAVGIKTGMRVKDGKLIDPRLVVVASDPDKYRAAHQRIKKLLLDYTDNIVPMSIDEFVLDLEGCPAFSKGMVQVAREIKQRILNEVGDWIRVNIGIAPNRFLAKTAAGLHKPDGLDEINVNNFMDIYSTLQLTDLCGIQKKYAVRLHQFGIYNVVDFFKADPLKLKHAFHSINGFDWYLRLKGWEVDDVVYPRRSFGNSFALGMNLSTPEKWAPILMKLVDKTAWRMRKQGFQSRGIFIGLSFKSGNHWHKGITTNKLYFYTQDIYKDMYRLLCHCPYREPVQILAESVFNLEKVQSAQLELFDDLNKKVDVIKAVDKIKAVYGQFAITPGTMMGTENIMPERVSFGGVKELLEYMNDDEIEDTDNFRDDIYPIVD